MCGGECNNLKYYAKLAETGQWFEVGEVSEVKLDAPDVSEEYLKSLERLSGTLTLKIVTTNNQRRHAGRKPIRWSQLKRIRLRSS